MADNDDTQAFLHIMETMRSLSTSKTTERITNELRTWKKRDRDSCATINRLTEDRHDLSKQSKAAADEIQKLSRKVESLQEEIASTKKRLAETNMVARDRGQKLGEETAKVTQLKQYRVDLGVESDGDIGNRWIQLWTLANQLATDYFSVDLDPDTLRQAHSWLPDTSRQYSKDFPAPAINSKEAKQMRTIAASTTIALALTRHIFRPIGLDDGCAEAMSRLARENPNMESFHRSAHLAAIDAQPDYRDTIIDRAVKAATAEIIHSVGQILLAANIREFQSQLEGVCRTAQREWRVFQQYKERYEVDMAGDDCFYDSVPLWEPAEAASPKTNGVANKSAQDAARNNQKTERTLPAKQKSKSAILVAYVWPLLKVADASGYVPKLEGLALFSDQTKEAEEQIMRLNRQVNRKEGKQDEKMNGPRPISIRMFLPSSPKSP